jgi:hypothetical protein
VADHCGLGTSLCLASSAADLSRKLFEGLQAISMIDEEGNVLEDPR